MICTAVFAYFIVVEENQCYAEGKDVFDEAKDGAIDVTKTFYLLAHAGIVLHLVQIFMYYLQSKEEMFT